MSGVAVAAGVSAAAAAASAGSQIAAGAAAKKGAANATKAANTANNQALALTGEAASQANAVWEQNYLNSLGVLQQGNNQNLGYLSPYSDIGSSAISQLQSGISPGQGAMPAIAAQGTPPEQLAVMQNQLAQLQAQAGEFQRAADTIMKNLQSPTVGSLPMQRITEMQNEYNAALSQAQALQPQIVQIQQQIQTAQATPYIPGRPATPAIPAGGGNLIRPFTANDYSLSPLAGGKPGSPGTFYNATQFQGAGNTGISNAEIQGWFASHPGVSDAEIIAAMQQYGISAQQIAAATGVSLGEVNQRISSVIDPSTVVAATPGAAPPDLTKNFDQSAYLAQGGLTQGDLIRPFDANGYLAQAGLTQGDISRPFDQNKFLAAGGRSIGDLTAKYNPRGFLAKGGLTEGDLIRPFDQNKFLAAGGRSLGDLTAKYDPAAFLKQGGVAPGDLFRKFTMADYEEDPGYAFRLAEGNKALNNSAAMQGNLLSGATLKAIDAYNSGQASQEYQNAYNRFTNTQGIQQNALNSDYNMFAGDQANLGNQLNAATNRYVQGQNVAQNALNSDYNRFAGDQANLGNQLNSAVNRYTQGQSIAQNALQLAGNQYLAGQGQAQNALTNAYNMYGTDRQNAANVYNQIYGYYNNDQTNQFNKLTNLAGIGQNAANNQSSINQAYTGNVVTQGNNWANNKASNIMAVGNAASGTTQQNGQNSAALAMQNGQINAQMIAGVGNAVGQGIGAAYGLYSPNTVSSFKPLAQGSTGTINPNWSLSNNAGQWGQSQW